MSVKIKICGITTPDDVKLVNRLKPDYAGFVLFYPESKRNLDIEQARRLVRQLDGVTPVAVTVSPTPEQAAAVSAAGFDMIQIHGKLFKETYTECDLPIIRAFNDFSSEKLAECKKLSRITAYLFDAAEPGSGKSFDWDKLKDLPTAGKEVFLAGGLTPDNVARAIESVNPDCVDVSTGIEMPDGGKDPELTELFVKNVRAAAGMESQE